MTDEEAIQILADEARRIFSKKQLQGVNTVFSMVWNLILDLGLDGLTLEQGKAIAQRVTDKLQEGLPADHMTRLGLAIFTLAKG